jgi:hypothetical protein
MNIFKYEEHYHLIQNNVISGEINYFDITDDNILTVFHKAGQTTIDFEKYTDRPNKQEMETLTSFFKMFGMELLDTGTVFLNKEQIQEKIQEMSLPKPKINVPLMAKLMTI